MTAPVPHSSGGDLYIFGRRLCSYCLRAFVTAFDAISSPSTLVTAKSTELATAVWAAVFGGSGAATGTSGGATPGAGQSGAVRVCDAPLIALGPEEEAPCAPVSPASSSAALDSGPHEVIVRRISENQPLLAGAIVPIVDEV